MACDNIEEMKYFTTIEHCNVGWALSAFHRVEKFLGIIAQQSWFFFYGSALSRL